jgi:DNA polymerase III gamma/tau subunit
VHNQLPNELLDLSDEEIEKIKSMDLDREKAMSMLDVLLKSEELIKRSMNARVAVELILCQLVTSTTRNPSPETKTNKGDFKQEIFSALKVRSPKLAALVHKSAVKIDGKDVAITADSEFTQKQLLQGKGTIESVLKKVLSDESSLRVEVADNAKKENSLEDTIRVLFDGEEVR